MHRVFLTCHCISFFGFLQIILKVSTTAREKVGLSCIESFHFFCKKLLLLFTIYFFCLQNRHYVELSIKNGFFFNEKLTHFIWLSLKPVQLNCFIISAAPHKALVPICT